MKHMALRISMIYGFVAALWIFFSDRALLSFSSDPSMFWRFSTYKGWAFVFVTGLLLYATLKGQVKKWQDEMSARLAAEQGLRQSDERYRLFIERAPVAIAMFDRAMRYMVVSRRWISDYGLGDQKIIGRSHYEVFPEIPEHWKKVHQRALAGATEKCDEEPFLRADGRTDWVRWEVIPWHEQDGTIGGIVILTEDISQRKLAEKAVRESDAKFRSYVEWSPFAVFVADPEGRILEVNHAAVDLLGIDSATLVGMHVRELHPPEDREQVLLDFANLAREGRIETEHRFLRGDGTIIWVSLLATMIEGEYSLSYCSDITSKRKAEEILKRYELLSEYSRDVILFVGREAGNILEANAAAERTFGYSRQEFLGMTIKDLRAPNTIGSMEKEMDEAETGGILLETIDRRKDGSTFPVEVSVRGATIAGTRALVAIVRDITERRQREEEIEMLKYSIDMHHDSISWLNRENEFVYVNEATCRNLGYRREELIGKPVYVVDPQLTSERLDEEWAALRREGLLVRESVHRRKDGIEFPVEITSSYVQFGGREFALTFARNVTEKKRLEDQLRQAQKMEAIGTLAGGVAHDFNNILTVIMGLANVIQMSLGPDDRLRPFLDQIVLSSERAAELTQSLLAFSRKQHISLTPHKLSGVVASTAKLLKRLLTEDIELKVEFADNDAMVMLDVAQIDQVLMNLATNARDAMPNGGTLLIRTARSMLDENFRKIHGFGRPGACVRLSVSDSGIGIDVETMARIFDPFFTTKELGKGTGLGLSSVYGVVKQHGGYITVASELLKGTTFDIYLPIVDASELAATKRAEAKGGFETILVIEDDRDVRNMITKVLSGRGYTTLEASNGDDAIEVFKERKATINLVILDVVMPGKNGREVLDEILLVNPAVKAIFMSGYTGDIVIDKGVEKESVDFLQKPLSVEKLLTKVREVLDG